MNQSPDSSASAEALIVPASADAGGAADFVRRCVVHGIDFYFEDLDTLPDRVPMGVRGVKAVFIDRSLMDEYRETLDGYERQGARIYAMSDADPSTPNSVLNWPSMLTFHNLTVDAGLTVRSAAARQRMTARDDARLFDQLGRHLLQRDSLDRWYDATSYQWGAMIDAYEITADRRYLDTALAQMRHMIAHVPNELSNCDTVAPFGPMLRMHEITGDAALRDYAATMFDRYLEQTPRCRGVLTNFNVYTNHVRSEILWQALAALAQLFRATGDDRYYEVMVDQFQKLHELLFDREQGLWHHAVGPAGHTDGFWARGAAFTLLGNLFVLEAMKKDDPRRAVVKEAMRATVERLAGLQDAEGFWTCVVDHPWTQPESSGTAWIGAAVQRGIRLGLIDAKHQPVADRAWDATKTRIWRGDFPGHMTATTATHVPGYYHKMHLSDTGWAHFAFRLACERRRESSVE